jgi:hypothetical protein
MRSLEIYFEDALLADIDFALGYVREMDNPTREKFVRNATAYTLYSMRAAGDLPSQDQDLDWLV